VRLLSMGYAFRPYLKIKNLLILNEEVLMYKFLISLS
jgi:hypothetical protein